MVASVKAAMGVAINASNVEMSLDLLSRRFFERFALFDKVMDPGEG